MISPLAARVIPSRLAQTIGVEAGIRSQLCAFGDSPSGDYETDALLISEARASEGRLAKLVTRWRELCPEAEMPAAEVAGVQKSRTPVEALRCAFELLSRGMVAYAALAPIANRLRDSAISAPEGTSGHAAREGLQECLLGMGRIAGLIPAVVVRELTAEGIECQCTCPACGLGVCVCGNGMRAVMSEAWMASRPVFSAPETPIPRPRSTSAARAAGLEEGDRILSIDGVGVVSYPQLQTSIKAREMGEAILFEVQRQGAKRRIPVVRLADVGDSDLPLDCEAPSGEAFYLDRARDLQQRLRQQREKGAVDGIESLSVRELQVLRLVVDGATNPMIAAKMHLKRPTVARHVQNILRKLNVTTRTEAAAIGAAHGLTVDA